MNPDLWIIDTFTPVPFRGNAAAVSVLDAFPTEEKMQMTALLANLSETAFVVPKGKSEYDLRWFTPDVEVDLSGHATLATAHTLHKMDFAQAGDTLRFHTKSGKLTATILDNGEIELDFPLLPGEPVELDPALKALGVKPLAIQRNREDDLVEVENAEILLGCTPDFKQLVNMQMRGVIVTTQDAPEGFDFASRYFAPKIGVKEDPVTGSAHCFLAPYWQKKLGKSKFRAYQASIGKGELGVEIKGDRVLITGKCITSIRGSIPEIAF